MEDLEDGWTSHIAPTGHTYYYNRSTKQSTYKRPIKRITPPAPVSEAISHPHTPTLTAGITNIPQATKSGSDIQDSNTPFNAESHAPETAHSLPQQHNVVNKTEDGDYPKHKFEISTADPWLLIETKKGREFYHNPQTNESHWELPTLLSEPLRQWRKSLEEQISDSELDNGIEEDNSSDESQADNFMPVDTEYNEEDIAWQLAAMEEEGQGQIHGIENDTPEFTLSEKIEIFQKMLSDLAIDPFSTWDAELPRIAADPRYLILENTHQRKSAFENYCTEQGMKIQEEKATTVKEDPQASFLQLVKAATSKIAYFQDFKRKHKKDSAYKNFGNSDHEREKLFRAFIDNKKLDHGQQEKNFRDLLISTGKDYKTDVRFYVLDKSSADRILQQQGIL